MLLVLSLIRSLLIYVHTVLILLAQQLIALSLHFGSIRAIRYLHPTSARLPERQSDMPAPIS